MLIDRPERLAAAAAAPKGTRLPANEVAVALDRRLSRETEGDVRFDAASRRSSRAWFSTTSTRS